MTGTMGGTVRVMMCSLCRTDLKVPRLRSENGKKEGHGPKPARLCLADSNSISKSMYLLV